MSVVLTSTPVVGLPALTGWAQVVHNHSGHLVCAYAVSGPNAHNLGRDLADLITSTELPDAIALHQLILDLLSRTRKAGSTLQFAAILQANNRLVVGAHQGQVLYHRDGMTRSLVKAEAEPQLLEGKLIPGTTLIALTQQAILHSELLTQQLTQGWDGDTIVTSLLPTLHDQGDSALSALAFVRVEGETPLTATSPIRNWVDETEPAEPTPPISGLLDEQPEPELAVSLPPEPLKTSLAPSRRHGLGLSGPAPTVFTALTALSPAWKNILAGIRTATTGLKKVTAWGFTAGQRITRIGQSSWQNWQQTLPKAKRQIVIAGGTIFLVIGLVVGSVTWYVQTKKSAGGSTPTQASSTPPAQPQELPVFFDLRLTEPNFLANRVIIHDKTAYFADLESKKIAQLDLAKKQSTLVPTDDFTKLTDMSLSDETLYFLGNGLSQWKDQPTGSATPSAQTLKTEGDSDRDGTILKSFGSYLYVLNPAKRNIFRFTVDKQSKISEPIGWLVNKKGLDFPQLVSMAIDGDVWLTDKTGQIFKFTQGQPADWKLSGLKVLPDSPVYAVTDENLAKLYVLEPNRSRLLVIDKNGSLVKEIESPTLAAVTSFGVSESLQKAFAVSGSTVYEIGL